VETFTSRFPLITEVAQDGGHYIPYRIPNFTAAEITALKDTAFSQIVADVLNLFFSCRLTALDVEFIIGRNPVRIEAVNHRVLFAELWRNMDGSFTFVTQRLYERIIGGEAQSEPTDWTKTAVLISVLFGIYGKLLHDQILDTDTEFDISVPADDFLIPMAMWYARKMGLPIRTIICACDETNSIWDLFHRGTFATNQAPESLLLGLEKIIVLTLGLEELQRFQESCKKGSIYTLDSEVLPGFSNGFFCSVAGNYRAGSTMNSVYRSNSYLIDPVTAICYGGAQDYRASTASGKPVVLVAQETPLNFAKEVIAATGISEAELHSCLRR
jgi:threonine synthase